ncbi:MFS family permease [Pseudonocardia antarctica]|uniref:MFS family permease n=1 Tax=Pseudonocardia alni TaxID=33907 RepID=A0A852WHH4_PSEA5|nr:MFS family permease [Pseudonocardia antarctica]
MLAAGATGFVGAIALGSFAAYLAAAVVAGAGFGVAFAGAMRVLLDRSPEGAHAGTLAAVYLYCYLAAAVASLCAGAAVDVWGLAPVASVLCVWSCRCWPWSLSDPRSGSAPGEQVTPRRHRAAAGAGRAGATVTVGRVDERCPAARVRGTRAATARSAARAGREVGSRGSARRRPGRHRPRCR